MAAAPGQGSEALAWRPVPGRQCRSASSNPPQGVGALDGGQHQVREQPWLVPGYQKSGLNLGRSCENESSQALGGEEVSNYRANLINVDRLC